MNKKLFKFVEGHPDEGGTNLSGTLTPVTQVKKIGDVEDTASEMVEPVAPGQYIDIVKDFKWTKTDRNSEGRKNTPAIELEEYYVTEPAFFTNMKTLGAVAATAATQTADSIEAVLNTAGVGSNQSVTNILSSIDTTLAQFTGSIGKESVFNKDVITGPAYLKAYEDTYGVKRTKFKYKLPYLENNYKSIRNQWGDGTSLLESLPGVGHGLDFIKTMMTAMSPGVGIDWAKSFKYDSTPPHHEIKFFLDNTKDSNYSGSPEVQVKDSSLKSNYDLNVGLAATHIPNYETNFRFIFLLLYQNLPNRLNKAAIAPPVIYRAKLPGVFSYRYCFFDNIKVNMVGVRKTKEINMFNNGSSNVVIPEGYEIELSIQSLVPESQNLYFDAIANPVISSVYRDAGTDPGGMWA